LRNTVTSALSTIPVATPSTNVAYLVLGFVLGSEPSAEEAGGFGHLIADAREALA
jgi:hypothetical protein